MNVDLMRKIDRYVGVPICFGLSSINWLGRPFKRKKPSKIKRVLFLQISEMGSTIMANESIEYVKKKHPDAEIYYLIFKEMQDSIRLLNVIPPENIITIRGNSAFGFVIDVIKTVVKLRAKKIDVSFDLELFSRVSAILSYMIGAKYNVGFYKHDMEGLYRGRFQTHKVWYNPHQHISLNFLSLVNALDAPAGETPLLKKTFGIDRVKAPAIKSTAAEKDAIFAKLQGINPKISKKHKIVVLNPNASNLIPIRRWPLRNYVALAEKLLEDKKVFLVITGMDYEKPDADAIIKHVGNERCINLAGKTRNIKELVDLYNISDLLITNDSGPAHFASCTQIKILAFYGPETPAVYGPLSRNCITMYSKYSCSPCVSAYNHRKTPCRDNKCLQAIAVDDACREIKKLIK